MKSVRTFPLKFSIRLWCKRPRERPDCQNSPEFKTQQSYIPKPLNPHPDSASIGLGTVLLGLGSSRTVLSCHCFLQSLCIISVPLPKWPHTARMLKGWKFCMKPNPSKEMTAMTANSLCTTLQTSIISETLLQKQLL